MLSVLKKLGLSGEIVGNGKSLVLCIHGWLDNCDSFKPMLNEKVNTKDYTWLAIDLPGHGESEWKSHDAHYYFIDYVYDLRTLIEELDFKKVFLVGHSMGAMICNLYAACYPERIAAMTLIDGIGIVTTKPSDTKQQLLNAFKQRKKSFESLVSKSFISFDDVVKARMKVSELDYDNAELLMKRNTDFVEHGVKLKTDPRLKQHSGFRFSTAQALSCLDGINTPTLFIKADQGYSMIDTQLELFRHCFLNLTISFMPGGHHCHMQNAAQTLQTISSHFDAYNET
ncbi:alpha/beta fold hydrolase [Pseudoalteromonas sp. MTN2-4]|uniref:alpha/beta fold hydrolase n=1 Tax=Pseudoalteromonas sp. MTN2-4 TaxID=3056555 RepID=UPI0036F30B94